MPGFSFVFYADCDAIGEDYRRKAADLREKAEKATIQEVKQTLVRIALQYDDLAAIAAVLKVIERSSSDKKIPRDAP
jgi:hypothetical protein